MGGKITTRCLESRGTPRQLISRKLIAFSPASIIQMSASAPKLLNCSRASIVRMKYYPMRPRGPSMID
uniref:Uncharacterized protein n=1 Tax=Rhizophora mucronata TaxID=61149 RepID=A0A2P2JD47_RHIMU